MSNYILKTARLSLRKFTTQDASFIFNLLNSEDWIKYIGNRNINTLKEAEDYIISVFLKSYDDASIGYYVVENNEDKIPMGICGLVKRTYLDELDYGFAFLPQYMNQGYAFEISNEFFQYAKNQLNIKRLYAITVSYNLRSIKLLEKLDFKFQHHIHPEEDEELMIYNLNL